MSMIIRTTLWLLLLASASAWPQAYPAKPVKAMIGYAPGSSTDIVGRLLAAKLSETWKQPVIVENRGGAATAATGTRSRSPLKGSFGFAATLIASPFCAIRMV